MTVEQYLKDQVSQLCGKIDDLAGSLQTFALAQVAVETKVGEVQRSIQRYDGNLLEMAGLDKQVALNSLGLETLKSAVTEQRLAFEGHKSCHMELERLAKRSNFDTVRTILVIMLGGITAELLRWLLK